MCIFCAAVPATAALGAAAHGKRSESAKTETATPPPNWLLTVPVGKVTGLAVAGLLAASVVYHAQIGPV